MSWSNLEVGSIIFGDIRAVALRQHHDLLLDIFDLIFGLLEINDLDGDNLLRPIVDAFEHLAEAAFSDPLLFGKYQLGVNLLKRKSKQKLNYHLTIINYQSKICFVYLSLNPRLKFHSEVQYFSIKFTLARLGIRGDNQPEITARVYLFFPFNSFFFFDTSFATCKPFLFCRCTRDADFNVRFRFFSFPH